MILQPNYKRLFALNSRLDQHCSYKNDLQIQLDLMHRTMTFPHVFFVNQKRTNFRTRSYLKTFSKILSVVR